MDDMVHILELLEETGELRMANNKKMYFLYNTLTNRPVYYDNGELIMYNNKSDAQEDCVFDEVVMDYKEGNGKQ